MKGSTKPLHRAALGLALLGAVVGAFSFSLDLNTTQPEPNGTGLPIKWPAGPIPLKIMLGTTPALEDGTNYSTTAEEAAKTWNANIGSVQFTVTVADPAPAGDFNGANELVFADKLFGQDFGEGVLAATATYSYGNRRYEADIIFNKNPAYIWDSYRGNLRVGSVWDLRRVALHELGHLLGLEHPDDAGQTVQAIMNRTIGNRYELSGDDLLGAHVLYGFPATPANDHFANSVLLVGGGNGAVLSTTSGNNAKATKEPGEPSHANDGGDDQQPNPGGRSVWWRWTAPSSGRMTIDTRGSYFDTLLGVHTGTAVGTLTRVAGNDDIDPGVVQASRVTFDAVVSTTYHIAVDGFNDDDGHGADSGGITLNLTFDGDPGSPPAISTHPASLTRIVGESAVFSVAATGTAPLTYQWYRNNTAIDGATDSSYTLASVAVANAGTYHCVVSNPTGPTTSNPATLTVNTPAPPPPSSGAGGGGGGGAPSAWFVVMLATLAVARLRRQNHT